MDTSQSDRNPSPPPEIVERAELITAESIGNTAFSKHWLFSTLMKLIEEVDREAKAETVSESVINVDEDLQNELCKLWDMSMNSEVAMFLNEFKAVDILTEVIQKSKAPRVTEICVGILGNLACEKAACKVISESQKLIDLILWLLETRDTPTLVENTRLIFTSLSNSSTRSPWIKAIQRSEEILDHLKFIFSSSTNCDLLKNTAELVDVLLDLEPDLCVSWATVDFIHSLLEATEQIGSNHSDAMEVYLHIFQNFSTTEPGVEALVEHGGRLTRKIMKYLNIVCEYEIVGVGQKEEPLTSALSVLNILITTLSPSQLGDVFNSEKLIRILLKILEPLYPMLQRFRNDNIAETSTEAKPVISQPADQVTSSDQYVHSIESGADQVTSSGQSENSMDSANASVDGVTSGKGGGGKSEADMEREQLALLEVLYEMLSGLLVDYCRIVLKEQEETNGSADASNSNPDSTSKESAKEDNSGSKEGDNSEDKTDVESTSELAGGDGSGISSDNKDSEPQTSEKSAQENADSKEDVQSETGVNCLPILMYLEEACSRSRINYLTLCLKETKEGEVQFEQLQMLGMKHNKARLCRILRDVMAGKIVARAESGRPEDAV